jgi:hypothetical protein
MRWMRSPDHPPDYVAPVAPTAPEGAAQPMRVLAPAPDFLPPLEGESAMLLHLLGQAFTDLIEGC